MLHLGLSASDMAAYQRALVAPRTARVSVAVQNLEGESLTSISPVVLDGQVDVDLDADVTRSATVTFLDPTHALNFDSDSPSDGALYADRMLRIRYAIRVPELDDLRVSAPVMTGPLVHFARSGDEVTVECQGKESLALNEIWTPHSLKRGLKKVDAIRQLLTDRCGETRFAFPDLPARLPSTISMSRQSIPWKVARRIARSMDRQLYYDGAGVCRLRAWSDRPLYTFRADSAHASITQPVQVEHGLDTIRNAVRVTGGKPKGAKEAVSATAVAPRDHPLSPWKLGRNNVPRWLVEEITDSNVRSHAEAQRLADRTLHDRLATVLGVTFSSVPIPFLDPGDMVRVATDAFGADFRLRKFSLPLGVDGEMSVGQNKRVSKPRKRRIR